MKTCVVCVITAGMASLAIMPSVSAGATPEQRKELAAIRKELNKATPLLRKKQFDEASALIDAVEEKLKATDVAPEDRSYKSVARQIAKMRSNLPVSFEREVAPILKENCLRCHGRQARGQLRLNTFAGMEQGGANGPLLVVGNSRQSRIMARISGSLAPRMPLRGEALPAEQVALIAKWIDQGAHYDGTDKSAEIGTAPASKPKPSVKVPKPDGSETVSFSDDIAPWMVNLCLRCHSGNNPRSGFSVESFEKILQGGDSGIVLVPGSLEESRLWDLVGKQDPIKMPAGQGLLRRSDHRNLRIWIEEGAKFDGEDATAPIRQLVPTSAERRAADIARMSPEELAKQHLEQAQSDWKRVLPKEEPKRIDSDEFFLFGNVSESRLREVGQWADEQAEALRLMFAEDSKPIWKGRLTVFVVKERFDYGEFNLVLLDRQPPAELTGHSVVSADGSQAYIVLLDVGDEVTQESAGLRANLVDHLAGAYLKRGGGTLPEWLLRGTGLVLAAKADPGNTFIRSLRPRAADAMQALSRPEDIFENGTFSPSEIGAVGYTLVSFLLNNGGGPAKLGQLVRSLHSGSSVAESLQSVYRSTTRNLAGAYLKNVRSK